MIRRTLTALAAVSAALALTFAAPGAANAYVGYVKYHKAVHTVVDRNAAGIPDIEVDSYLTYDYDVDVLTSDGYRSFVSHPRAKICVDVNNGDIPGSLDAVRFRTTFYLNTTATPLGNTGVITTLTSAPGNGTRYCSGNFTIYTGSTQYGTGYPFRFETHGTVIISGASDYDFQVKGDYGNLNTLRGVSDPDA